MLAILHARRRQHNQLAGKIDLAPTQHTDLLTTLGPANRGRRLDTAERQAIEQRNAGLA
jgi:hypothetical protein